MKDASQNLSSRLAEESPEVRRRAVLDIAALAPAECVTLTLTALDDEDWRVRKEAARVAAELSHRPGMIDALLGAISQEDNVGLRNAAAEALVEAGAQAITAVIGELPSLDVAGSKIAVEILGASDDPRVVDVLIGCLEDVDRNVRGTAAEALGEKGGARSTEALVRCLASDDRLLVLAALQSLNHLEARVPWAALEPLIADPLYGTDLLFVLARGGSVEAAPLITRALEDEPQAAMALEILHRSSDEGAAAVESHLEKIGEETRSLLKQLTDEGEPAEQQAAACCLLWTRPVDDIASVVDIARAETLYSTLLTELRRWGGEAVAALEKGIAEFEGRRLASAVGLLTRLYDVEEGKKRAPLFRRLLDSEDPVVATAAAGAIARFGDISSLDRLLELADAGENRIRRAAGYAMTEIGRRQPRETARRLASVEIKGWRGIQLCRVLEVVGSGDDAERLTAALGSPDISLRGSVLRALAVTSGAAAVETIARGMTDEELSVREAATVALARVGPPAAETIVSALHTAEGPLKASLARALGKVGHPEAPEILKGLCVESAEVSLAALAALRELDVGRDAGLEALIRSHDESEVVKRALALLDTEISVSRLVSLVDHPAWDVRLAVVDLLAGMKNASGVVEALEDRFAREQDDLVRRAIERVLGVRESEA